MPLGADMVQFTKDAPLEEIHCVVVEHAVVTLMPGGEQQTGVVDLDPNEWRQVPDKELPNRAKQPPRDESNRH